MEYGNKTALALKMGVSPAAVTKLFKKYNISSRIVIADDNRFLLCDAEAIINLERNKKRHFAQVNHNKIVKPKPVKNSKIIRTVFAEHLFVFDNAVKKQLLTGIEQGYDDFDLLSIIDNADCFFDAFYSELNKLYPAELLDMEFIRPAYLNINSVEELRNKINEIISDGNSNNK